jgi:cell wall-associated NlpC family hydrolase
MAACERPKSGERLDEAITDTVQTQTKALTSSAPYQQIETGNTSPNDLIAFSKTLIGTPYKYGSADPAQGFDCSGFITFVFNHFNIQVPRTSVDFTNVGREIDIGNAKPGDIILFTGTDSAIRIVGHMGIITSASNKDIQFIHSTSGKANGVTITALNDYYLGRFVKVIRCLSKTIRIKY